MILEKQNAFFKMYWNSYVFTVLFGNTRDTKSLRKLQKYLEGRELGLRCERKAARQPCGIVRRESMKQLRQLNIVYCDCYKLLEHVPITQPFL